MSSLVSPQEILSSLDQCLIKDRHFLATRCRRIATLKKSSKPTKQLESVVDHAFKKSVEAYKGRKARVPEVVLAADLPVSEHAEKIGAAIAEHQVVIVAGETGSGKTTQLPKICLQLGLGTAGMIGHTQPRRLAAARLPVALPRS